MNISIKDFFLPIWSHLLKKPLMENFIFFVQWFLLTGLSIAVSKFVFFINISSFLNSDFILSSVTLFFANIFDVTNNIKNFGPHY